MPPHQYHTTGRLSAVLAKYHTGRLSAVLATRHSQSTCSLPLLHVIQNWQLHLLPAGPAKCMLLLLLLHRSRPHEQETTGHTEREEVRGHQSSVTLLQHITNWAAAMQPSSQRMTTGLGASASANACLLLVCASSGGARPTHPDILAR